MGRFVMSYGELSRECGSSLCVIQMAVSLRLRSESGSGGLFPIENQNNSTDLPCTRNVFTHSAITITIAQTSG